MLGLDEWSPQDRQPCTVSLGQCLVAVGPMRILCISFVGTEINVVNFSWSNKSGGRIAFKVLIITGKEGVQGIT